MCAIKKRYIIIFVLITIIGSFFVFSNTAKADDLQEASKKFDTLSTQYNDALMRKATAENELNVTTTKINELEAQHKVLKKELDNYTVYLYKHGAPTLIDIIFSSDSLQETISTIDSLNKIAENKSYMLEKVDSTTEKLNKEKETLAAKYKEIEEQTKIAEKAKQDAEKELNELKIQNLALNFTPEVCDPALTNNPVVKRAYEEQGKPYVWAAVGPDGYDCSGLVSYCLSGEHKRLGTTTTFMCWPETTTPQPGDIITNSEHCGIYIGGNKMIHAPQPGDVVRVTTVDWMLRNGSKFVKYPG